MKILVHVNQKESVRAGHDAPHSTHLYEINPTELPEDLRVWLADYWDPATGRVAAPVYGVPETATPLVITRSATTESLIAAMTLLKSGNDAHRAAVAAQDAKEAAEDADYERYLAQPVAAFITSETGERLPATAIVDADGDVETAVTIHLTSPYYPTGRLPLVTFAVANVKHHPTKYSWNSWSAKREVVYQTAKAAARKINLPLWEQLHEPALAEKARTAAEASAQTQRLKDQLTAHLAGVGGLLAERYAAGYATDAEVMNSIRAGERARCGVTFTGGNADWVRAEGDPYTGPLTDDQFRTLKEWQSKLPEIATVKIFELHNHAVDPDDGAENTDTQIGRILVAEATWKVGEVAVKADTQIGTLPDLGDET